MKYKILTLDLDGTLTNSQKELTDKTKTALLEYQKNGGIVVLASGRPAYGIQPLAQILELQKYGGYILAFNGGQIIDCKNQSVIWQKVIPLEMTRDLAELARKYHVAIMTYYGNQLITETPEHFYVKKEKEINHMEIKPVNSFAEYVDFPMAKCLLAEEENHLAQVEKVAQKIFGESLSIYRSEPFFLEIMPEGIDKAKSLQWLLAQLEIEKKHMVAFGDGFNDQTMIEFAGLGVAMGNAQDQVKKIADLIAPINDENGVAWVLENVVGIS